MAIVGAYEDDDKGSDSGSAYIYAFDSNTDAWDETKVTASDGASDDYFGQSVSISGMSAIVGAPTDGFDTGSAYIFTYNKSTNIWDETIITASDEANFDYFGQSVSISGTSAIVGAPEDDDNGSDSGSAYIYVLDTNTNSWEETKITASDGVTRDEFGYSVSISGTSAIVGAHEDEDNGTRSGSAYIYVFDSNTDTWDETKITARDADSYDYFGQSVSISGTSAIVGAHEDEENGFRSGSVYIFDTITKTGSSKGDWSEYKLAASDAASGDEFGRSVSTSGTSVIVGAYKSNAVDTDSGAAYIYLYDTNTGTWDETKITASDGAAGDFFGWSTSIFGTSAIVGARRDDDSGTSSGSAYIYVYDSNTHIWEETKITASDAAADDEFGYSVSTSGTTVIVGSYLDDDTASDSGSSYIYNFNSISNTWDETKLVASDAAADDNFGWSVSISGTSAIVGSYHDDDDGSNSGSAYIYIFDSNLNTWNETKLNSSDAAGNDLFGYSVSISGTSAIVGAYGDDDNGSTSGSAYIYVYQTNTNTWDETKITASDGASLDDFGVSVSISGTSAIVGAWGNSDAGAYSGSAYIYTFSSITNNWIEKKITASDAAASSNFGRSVSIFGTSAIVGSYGSDIIGSNSGLVYIYDLEF